MAISMALLQGHFTKCFLTVATARPSLHHFCCHLCSQRLWKPTPSVLSTPIPQLYLRIHALPSGNTLRPLPFGHGSLLLLVPNTPAPSQPRPALPIFLFHSKGGGCARSFPLFLSMISQRKREEALI